MLQAQSRGWLSNDYDLLRDGEPVAVLDLSNWQERAELEFDQQRWILDREGWLNGVFRLLDDLEHPVAVAEKVGFWRNTWEITHSDRRFVVERESLWRPDFVVREKFPGRSPTGEDQETIGRVARKGLLRYQVSVDLPEDLRLPVQAFICWLVLVLWKREAAAAAAGS